MTINADTYIHDMLAVSGGSNVFGGAVSGTRRSPSTRSRPPTRR